VKHSLEVAALGDREILMTRSFDAPRRLVWRAFTEPALLRRWLLGPDGWTMTVCEIDLRAGGDYRYVWYHPQRKVEMGMGGRYVEIVPETRIVNTEVFDEAWYEGDMTGTLTFDEDGGVTTTKQVLRYDSRATRDAVLKSPMETGVKAGYDRLDDLLRAL
jgi:uncharacterized protein YndB with AHSA1/START domain